MGISIARSQLPKHCGAFRTCPATSPSRPKTNQRLTTSSPSAERRAWTQLHRGTSEPIESDTESKSPVMAVRPNQPGDGGQNNESVLHYALKTFVVRWLIESEGHGFASVTTEIDTPLAQQTSQQLIPDIQHHGTVFEIETLYGTGSPLFALKETIEKYHRHGKSPDICLVLPPLAGFLYHSEIMRLTDEINEQWGLVVTPADSEPPIYRISSTQTPPSTPSSRTNNSLSKHQIVSHHLYPKTRRENRDPYPQASIAASRE